MTILNILSRKKSTLLLEMKLYSNVILDKQVSIFHCMHRKFQKLMFLIVIKLHQRQQKVLETVESSKTVMIQSVMDKSNPMQIILVANIESELAIFKFDIIISHLSSYRYFKFNLLMVVASNNYTIF